VLYALLIVAVAIEYYYKGGFNVLEDSGSAIHRWQNHLRRAARSGVLYDNNKRRFMKRYYRNSIYLFKHFI
jgi:hypothetical protein